METVEQLRPIFEEHWPTGWATQPSYKWTDKDLMVVAKLRHRAKTEHFFLANQLLDCDFYEDVHTALFDAMLQKDPTKPLHEQAAIKRRLLLWSRGHYKTTAEVVEIVQLILCWPQLTILVVSGVQKLVKEILALAKSAFETNQKMRELFPEFCGKKLGDQYGFSIPLRVKTAKNRGETVKCLTPKMVKSGTHADVVFLDDLQHDKNWKTPDLLIGVQQEFFNFSGPVVGEGLTYVLGTRYVHGDLYEFILNMITEGGFKPLKLLKEYKITERWTEANQISHDGNWLVSIRPCWKLFPNSEIDLLFSQRGPASDGKMKGFTINSLGQIRATNATEFACHYELRPVAGGEPIFTEALFDSCAAIEPDVPKRGSTIIVWDLAWGSHENADQCVGFVARLNPRGKIYIIDCVAGNFDPDSLVKHIIALHAKWHVPITYLEEAQGAPWLAANITNYCKLIGIEPINIGFIKPSNQKGIKDIRIRSLVPLMQAGRIAFFAGMLEYDNIKKGFVTYGTTKHDDYPDGVSLLLEVLPMVDPTPSRMELELMRHQAETITALEPNPFSG